MNRSINSEKKPLVYHIITKLELGGAQRVTLQTLENLDRSRFRVGLISGSEGELVDEARKLKDCSVHLLPSLKHPIKLLHDFRALFQIKKIFKAEGVSVIHTHSSKAGILGRWAARMAGVPVIVHSVHGWSFNDYQNPLKRILYTVLEKLSSRITTHFFLESKKHIEIGKKKGLFKKSAYSLLLPGIDFSEFDKIYKSKGRVIPGEFKKQRETGKKIITMIACFKHQKAPLDFVRAAEFVLEKKGNMHFFMIGDGVLRLDIENLIREKKLRDSISLLGWRKDIPPIIFASDVVVLTSLWEGMPTVLPMATRAGIPVVANNIDGCREFVIDGENGWLSEPGNPESAAINILKVLEDSDASKRIEKIRLKITKKFEIGYTTGFQAEQYLKLLDKR